MFKSNLALKTLEKAIKLLRKQYNYNMEVYNKNKITILKIKLYLLLHLSNWEEAFELYEVLLDSPNFEIKNSIKLFKFDSINQSIIFPKVNSSSDKEEARFHFKLASLFSKKGGKLEDLYILKRELKILDYVMAVYKSFSSLSTSD